jgi:hypothetical protein
MMIQEVAQTALDVQNAVNLSGVLQSFRDIVMDVLWPEARRLGKGTDWVNHHPICTLFLNKLSDLNRRPDYFKAYVEVQELCEHADETGSDPRNSDRHRSTAERRERLNLKEGGFSRRNL